MCNSAIDLLVNLQMPECTSIIVHFRLYLIFVKATLDIKTVSYATARWTFIMQLYALHFLRVNILFYSCYFVWLYFQRRRQKHIATDIDFFRKLSWWSKLWLWWGSMNEPAYSWCPAKIPCLFCYHGGTKLFPITSLLTSVFRPMWIYIMLKMN